MAGAKVSKARLKEIGAAKKPIVQFVDGAKIPTQLLGELRAAKAELDAAAAECEEHNRIGQIKQQRWNRASHVLDHYAERARTRLKAGPHDVLDLDRGIISIRKTGE